MSGPHSILEFPPFERSPDRMSSSNETRDSKCRDLERRRSTRYAISLPVQCGWEEPNGSVQKFSGFTKNIGPQGVSVVAEAVPSEGTSIDITVLLPGRPPKAGTRVQMRGKGHVVRVDPDGCFAAKAVFRIVRVHEVDGGLFARIQYENNSYLQLPSISGRCTVLQRWST